MKKFLSIVLAIAIGLSLSTMAFAATNVTPQAVVTVTLDTAGGNTILPLSGETGSAMTVPTPVRTGFTFAGWTPTPGTTFPAANVTLVAQWTAVVTTTAAPKGTICFVLNNAQVNVYQDGTPGATIQNPTIPTKAGYTFAGWEPLIAGVTYPADGATTVVQAKWVLTVADTTVVVPVTDPTLDWVYLLGDQIVAFNSDAQVKSLKAQAKDLLAKGSTGDIAALADSIVKKVSDATGVDVDALKAKLSDNAIVQKFMGIYTPAKATTTVAVTEAPVVTTDAPVIPDTGSAVGGIAIFATLSLAAAAAFVCSKKN